MYYAVSATNLAGEGPRTDVICVHANPVYVVSRGYDDAPIIGCKD